MPSSSTSTVPTPFTFAVCSETVATGPPDADSDSDSEAEAPMLLDSVASDGVVLRLVEVSGAAGVPLSLEQAASAQRATATSVIRMAFMGIPFVPRPRLGVPDAELGKPPNTAIGGPRRVRASRVASLDARPIDECCPNRHGFRAARCARHRAGRGCRVLRHPPDRG